MSLPKNINPIGMSQAIARVQAEQALIKPKLRTAPQAPPPNAVLLAHPHQLGTGPLRSGWAGAAAVFKGSTGSAAARTAHVARLSASLTNPVTAFVAVTSLGYSLMSQQTSQPPLKYGSASQPKNTGLDLHSVPTADKPRVLLDEYFGHTSGQPTTPPGLPDHLPQGLKHASTPGRATHQDNVQPLSGPEASALPPMGLGGFKPHERDRHDGLYLSQGEGFDMRRWLRNQAASDPLDIQTLLDAAEQVAAVTSPGSLLAYFEKIDSKLRDVAPLSNEQIVQATHQEGADKKLLTYRFEPKFTLKSGETIDIPLERPLPSIGHHGYYAELINRLLFAYVHSAEKSIPQARHVAGDEYQLMQALLDRVKMGDDEIETLALNASAFQLPENKKMLQQLAQAPYDPDGIRAASAQAALQELSGAVYAVLDAGFRYLDSGFVAGEFLVLFGRR